MRRILSPLMKSVCASCVLLTIALSGSADNERQARVLSQNKEGDLAFYELILPPTQFNRETLLTLARDYEARNSAAHILSVSIYDNEQAYRSMFSTKGTFHINTSQWQDALRARFAAAPHAVAEIVQFGKNAALRIKYRSGETEELVLSGDNVFHLSLEKEQLDLLYLGPSVGMDGGSERLEAAVFFRTTRCIGPEAGERLVQAFAHTVPTDRMQLHFSPNSWFVFHSDYPLQSSFDGRAYVPSPEEIGRNSEVSCRATRKPMCFPSLPRGCDEAISQTQAPQPDCLKCKTVSPGNSPKYRIARRIRTTCDAQTKGGLWLNVSIHPDQFTKPALSALACRLALDFPEDELMVQIFDNHDSARKFVAPWEQQKPAGWMRHVQAWRASYRRDVPKHEHWLIWRPDSGKTSEERIDLCAVTGE